MPSYITVRPKEIKISNANKITVDVTGNGQLELNAYQYKAPNIREKRQALQGVAGLELINDEQTLVKHLKRETITTQKGQRLVVVGVSGEADNFTLLNPKGYRTGLRSISLDGQGGGSFPGGYSKTLNTGDHYNLDLTDPNTEVTVKSHRNNPGSFDTKASFDTDTISIPRRKQGAKLKVESTNYTTSGGWIDRKQRSYLFPDLESRSFEHRPRNANTTLININGYTQHLDTLDSYTYTFTRDN